MLPRLFTLLLLLALPVLAQEIPPDAVPAVPGEPAPLPVETEGKGEAKMITNMQYPNANVQAVLMLYETLTGKKVISDTSVQGNLSIMINSPVSETEAVSIIEKSLILNGFSVVPSDGNVVKVLGPGKPTRSASIPIFSEPSQIPPGELIISYVFKLNYADPTELANVLNQYLATGMPYTSFLPLPKTQAILVTETTSTIRNLIGLIAQIDNPPAGVVSEFLQLRRADAAKVVEYLNELFQAKQQQQQQGGAPAAPGQPQQTNRRRVNPEEVPPPPEGLSPEVGAAFLSEDNIIVGKIKLTADTRTNRIHVVTRPENLPFLRSLVSEFDANVDIGTPITRPLRYVAAGEVLPILVQTLKEPGIETEEAKGGGGTNPAGSTSSTGGGGGGLSSSSDSGGGGGATIGAEQLNTQQADTAPEAVTIGSTRLIADKRSNAIIIMGNEDVRQKVMKVIDEIDVRAPQVLLNTVIGELSLSNNDEFGVSYLLRNFDIGKYISTAGLIRNVSEGIVFPSGDGGNANTSNINRARPSFGTSGGLAGVITIDNGLDIIVRALEGSGRFRTTSRPMIFTSNNKKAVIASGTEVAVPVSSLTSQDAGVPVTSSNIQFKPIELRLEVVPLINAEDEVNLEVLQKVDSQSGVTPIDGNDIPTIATRYIRTSVTLPNRATVILGGLITEDHRRSRSGIPIISDIPVIGALFSNTAKTKTRTELIVLIRPVVLHTKDDMLIQKHVEEQRLYLPNNLEEDLSPESVTTTTTVSEKNGSLWWKRSTKETIVDETVPVPSATPRRRNIYRN